MNYSILAETMAPSEILHIGNRVKQLVSEGETIYNLTVGDFDPAIFPIPRQLEDEIVTAYRQQLTNYPLPEGNLDLRQAIKRYIKEFQALDYTENEILVGSGGRPLIYALFRSICDPGDRIVYPVPSWNNHNYTHLAGGDPIVIETSAENKFMPQAEEIRPFIRDATLIALCSPQNPTGTTFTREALLEIADMVVTENKRRSEGEKKLYIFFDQLYSQLVYGTTRHYHPVELNPDIKPYTITVDAISKSFAATGLRVGWCFGPAGLIGKMKILLTHIGAWAPMPEQKGLARYLDRKNDLPVFLDRFKAELSCRLQYLYAGVIRLKNEGYPVDAIEPEAAVFLSVKIDLVGQSVKDGQQLIDGPAVTKYLLETARLAIIPFSAFGSHNNDAWYRLSVGTSKSGELEQAIRSLRQALDNCTAPQLILST